MGEWNEERQSTTGMEGREMVEDGGMVVQDWQSERKRVGRGNLFKGGGGESVCESHQTHGIE